MFATVNVPFFVTRVNVPVAQIYMSKKEELVKILRHI